MQITSISNNNYGIFEFQASNESGCIQKIIELIKTIFKSIGDFFYSLVCCRYSKEENQSQSGTSDAFNKKLSAEQKVLKNLTNLTNPLEALFNPTQLEWKHAPIERRVHQVMKNEDLKLKKRLEKAIEKPATCNAKLQDILSHCHLPNQLELLQELRDNLPEYFLKTMKDFFEYHFDWQPQFENLKAEIPPLLNEIAQILSKSGIKHLQGIWIEYQKQFINGLSQNEDSPETFFASWKKEFIQAIESAELFDKAQFFFDLQQETSVFSTLLRENREKLSKIVFIHGTRSSCLPLVIRGKDQSFKSTGALAKENSVTLTGENDRGVTEFGVNQKFLSGVSKFNATLSIEYAEVISGNRWFTFSEANEFIQEQVSAFHADTQTVDTLMDPLEIINMLNQFKSLIGTFLLNSGSVPIQRYLKQLRLANEEMFTKELLPELNRLYEAFRNCFANIVKLPDSTNKNLVLLSLLSMMPKLNELIEELKIPLPFKSGFTEQEIEWFDDSFPIVVASSNVPAESLQKHTQKATFFEELVVEKLSLKDQVQWIFTSNSRGEELKQYLDGHGLSHIEVLPIDILCLLQSLELYEDAKNFKQSHTQYFR